MLLILATMDIYVTHILGISQCHHVLCGVRRLRAAFCAQPQHPTDSSCTAELTAPRWLGRASEPLAPRRMGRKRLSHPAPQPHAAPSVQPIQPTRPASPYSQPGLWPPQRLTDPQKRRCCGCVPMQSRCPSPAAHPPSHAQLPSSAPEPHGLHLGPVESHTHPCYAVHVGAPGARTLPLGRQHHQQQARWVRWGRA